MDLPFSEQEPVNGLRRPLSNVHASPMVHFSIPELTFLLATMKLWKVEAGSAPDLVGRVIAGDIAVDYLALSMRDPIQRWSMTTHLGVPLETSL